MLETCKRVIKHKLGLLNLAEDLGNVSKACKVMGVSRDTFCRYRATVDDGGVDALVDKTRHKPRHRIRRLIYLTTPHRQPSGTKSALINKPTFMSYARRVNSDENRRLYSSTIQQIAQRDWLVVTQVAPEMNMNEPSIPLTEKLIDPFE